jgi:predicted dehydrogenase
MGVGIIGCGWVAEEYVKAFGNDPRSEVRALVSRSTARPEGYRARYNLKCTVGTDAAEMLRRKDVDIVVVSTPHDLHTPYVVAAAEAGKHVVIEKPVATTREEVRRQQETVRRAGVKTIVSFVLHWNPLLMTVDRLIEQGAFGNIFMVEVDYMHRIWSGPERWLGTRKQGGTSFVAGGCHAVDALRWFARSEVVEVTAYQVKTENPIEYPGTNNAIVKFADGKVGRTTSCFDAQMPYRFNIAVYGTEGAVRNEQIFAPKLFPGQNDFMRIPCILPDSGDVAHHPFQGEASHFLDCVLEDRRPFPDLDDAAKTMAVCFAADRSAEEGRPVAIAEL